MREYNIRDFGAIADGKTNNAESIQAAIETCASEGGGRVLVSGGTYLTGTLVLRSGVELHIAADGVLLASANREDFPEFPKQHVDVSKLSRFSGAAMIYAERCENISITGMGKIDGNGYAYVTPCAPYHSGWSYRRNGANTLPRVVFFAGCKNVLVEDVAVVDAPAGWAYWIHDCDFVRFDRAKVLCALDFPNNDGIHINSSRDVTVSNCEIRTGDDCIILRAANRSLYEPKVCERVTVTGCTLMSRTNAIRIGWVGDGTIRDCKLSDLTIDQTRTGIAIYLPTAAVAFSDNNAQSCGADEKKRDLGASALEKTHIENISFSNITMKNLYLSPLEIEIDTDENTPCDCIKNIRFRHIYAETLGFFAIIGREGNAVENICFCDCEFRQLRPESVAYYFEETLKEIHPLTLKFAKNVTFENTAFSSEEC
jgi:polygalacturonase